MAINGRVIQALSHIEKPVQNTVGDNYRIEEKRFRLVDASAVITLNGVAAGRTDLVLRTDLHEASHGGPWESKR
jgi:hypothetical protein